MMRSAADVNASTPKQHVATASSCRARTARI